MNVSKEMLGRFVMRILIISQYYPPDVGGSHRRAFNAVKGLEKRGHQVEVLTAVPHYPLGKIPARYSRKLLSIENEDKHRVVRVWLPSVAHQGFARRLLMYILFSFMALLALPVMKRPNVIWASSPGVFSSFPAMMFSLVRRAPVVRNVDDLWPETANQLGFLSRRQLRFGEAAAKLSYILCKTLTPISQAYCSVLSKKYGVQESRLHVVEVGVDLSTIPKVEYNGVTNKDRFDVVYSGLLGTGYDFDVVLDAAKELQDDHSIHFLIRGLGEMEHSIRSKVAELNLTNVTVSSEFLERVALMELLTNADALLLPMKPLDSSDSGLPTKLFEYMACGRPVICCSAGESARVVTEARCGIVVSPGDSSGLVQAISKLKENNTRNQLGRNGRQFAEEHFSLDRIAEKLEEAFLKAIPD